MLRHEELRVIASSLWSTVALAPGSGLRRTVRDAAPKAVANRPAACLPRAKSSSLERCLLKVSRRKDELAARQARAQLAQESVKNRERTLKSHALMLDALTGP